MMAQLHPPLLLLVTSSPCQNVLLAEDKHKEKSLALLLHQQSPATVLREQAVSDISHQFAGPSGWCEQT